MGTFLTLMTRKSADDESKAPLYSVMMVERLEPKRFPTLAGINKNDQKNIEVYLALLYGFLKADVLSYVKLLNFAALFDSDSDKACFSSMHKKDIDLSQGRKLHSETCTSLSGPKSFSIFFFLKPHNSP